jgi:hypothetical protein
MGNGENENGHPKPVVVLNRTGSAPLPGVTQLDAGFYTACARLRSGEARCWGSGAFGQIGNGSGDHALLPARVLTVA